MWVYFLFCSVLTGYALASRSPDIAAINGTWRAVFTGMATLAATASFGQREYLCVVLVMPYLALSAARAQENHEVDTLGSLLVGLLAGIGFAIKPYFLAVPALIEGALVIRLGWRSIFRPESVA